MRISVTSALYGGENIAVASFKFPLMRANFCTGGFVCQGKSSATLMKCQGTDARDIFPPGTDARFCNFC